MWLTSVSLIVATAFAAFRRLATRTRRCNRVRIYCRASLPRGAAEPLGVAGAGRSGWQRRAQLGPPRSGWDYSADEADFVRGPSKRLRWTRAGLESPMGAVVRVNGWKPTEPCPPSIWRRAFIQTELQPDRSQSQSPSVLVCARA